MCFVCLIFDEIYYVADQIISEIRDHARKLLWLQAKNNWTEIDKSRPDFPPLLPYDFLITVIFIVASKADSCSRVKTKASPLCSSDTRKRPEDKSTIFTGRIQSCWSAIRHWRPAIYFDESVLAIFLKQFLCPANFSTAWLLKFTQFPLHAWQLSFAW